VRYLTARSAGHLARTRSARLLPFHGDAAFSSPAAHTREHRRSSRGTTRLITEFRYEDVGNRTAVIDANGQITQYLYDERDELEFVKQSPSVWQLSGGSIPSAPADTITTKYVYDNLGYLTQVVRANGDSTSARGVDYLYDGVGRLRQEKQYPSWPTLSSPLVTDYTYDGNGNLTLLREPNSQPSDGVTYAYDDLNRLTAINYSSSGTPDVSYTYDVHGNRTLMDSGTPDTTYTYDALDRLLSVAMSGSDTVGYRYDRDGNRRRLIYPGSTGNVDYTFEKDGKLASLTDWASRTTSYGYFANGSVKDVTYPNSTKGAFSYDNALRLTEIHHQTTGGTPNTITRHKYTLDKVGNRLRLDEVLADIGSPTGGLITPGAQPNSFAPAALQSTMIRYGTANDASAIPQFTATIKQSTTTVRTLTSSAGSSFVVWDGKDGSGNIQPPGSYTAEISGQANQTITLTRQASHSYTYDRLYRLTRADNAFGPISYAYDPLGNRLSTSSELSKTNYTHDKLDRLTQVGSTAYTNDNNGNRTARGGDTFAYDQANRLTQFDPTATSATDYAYDGDGKRLCKSSTCSTPEFTYDVNRGLPVLLKDSTRLYVWGLGLAYAVDGSNIEVHHADGLGSVRALTNGSASVGTTYLTDEFGVSRLVRGAEQRMQYTGEPRDSESGFVYLRARTYDPAVGRFLQRDPFTGFLSAPSSLQRYSYAYNSPASLVDATGTSPCLPTIIGNPGCITIAPPIAPLKPVEQKQVIQTDKGCGPYASKGVVLRKTPFAGALAHGPEPDGQGTCHVNLQLAQLGVSAKRALVNFHIFHKDPVGFVALGAGAPAPPANELGNDPISAAAKAIASFVVAIKIAAPDIDTSPITGTSFFTHLTQMLETLKSHSGASQ
jgi:RHS repeat-associated protein